MASPFALPFSPRPFSPLLPLEVGPLLRLGVWGSAYKLPQLVRAKPRRQYRRLLVHIQPIWAYFGKHFRAISPWYFCGEGTSPVTAMTVSTQPGVHGITGVWVFHSVCTL